MPVLQGDAGIKKKQPVTAALAPVVGTANTPYGPYIGTAAGSGPSMPFPGGVPPAAPGPAGPADTSGGGSAPDPWNQNPGYLAAIAAEQTGTQQADAALRAAQEAAIVGYGDPTLAAALGINVDPTVAAAARQNYLAGNASLARLDKQHQLNQQGSINNLAAHGILFSGETGYQRGNIDQTYGNDVYDAQQALLNQNRQWLAQNVATKQGLHTDVVNAATGAYNTAVANPAVYAQPGATNPTVTGAPAATAAATPAAALAQQPLKTAGSRLAGKQTNPYALARRFS